MKNRELLFLLIALAMVATRPVQTARAETAGALKPHPQTSQPIPWSEVGSKATAQYSGEGLTVFTDPRGAVRLRCAFQRIEGEVTDKGLWLSSTAESTPTERFRVVADYVGRNGGALVALGERGVAACNAGLARFDRRELREEYSVSVDGLRQDFVVLERPTDLAGTEARQRPGVRQPSGALEVVGGRMRQRAGALQDLSVVRTVEDERAAAGEGGLRVELAVTGAKAEALVNGARLVLDGSGRKLAYNRLRVVDAQGRELPARMEVAAANRLALVVDDTAAVYPVRIDPTFSDENWISMGGLPGANGEVWDMVADGAGNIYFGGNFTVMGNVTANCVAKWDGSKWSALGSGLNDGVSALAVSGTNLYVGGNFTRAGGTAAARIAKWNGSAWSALGSGLNGGVEALAVLGSDLYVGGYFSTAGGAGGYYHLAKWNGSTWSRLGLGGVDGPVLALAVSGTDLYVGGDFTAVYGLIPAANHIAKWDGNAWSALGSGLDNGAPNTSVYALAVSGTSLYVGGFFTSAGGTPASSIAKWDGSTWSPLGSGVSQAVYTSSVGALAVLGTELFVGGSFTEAGGLAATNMARWNGSAWSAAGTEWSGGVSAMAVSGGGMYAVGLAYRNLTKWDGNSWPAVDLNLNLGLNNSVLALAVSGTNLFAGGAFTMAGGAPVNHIAKWNGSTYSPLGPGLNGEVWALAVSGTDLYAGGDFTEAGGAPAKNIAKWDGSAWSALGAGLDAKVNALAVSGSDIYAGGYFANADGTPANCIAKWDGSAWSPLGSGTELGQAGVVFALAVSGGDLFVGGIFTFSGQPGDVNIAKWDGSAWSELGLAGYYNVSALAVSGTELYAGGGGPGGATLAKWNGSTWTGLGSGLSGNLVSALAVSGTNLYVTGDFTRAGGITCNGIARWDGSAWSRMGSGLNFAGNALAVLGPDLYVGGYFDVAGGKVSAGLARANISPPSVPVIWNIGRAGTNVVLRGTNGPAGAAYYVLAGTNVAQPRANWARLATNRFDATGSFTFTNQLAPFVPQRFFSLEVP